MKPTIALLLFFVCLSSCKHHPVQPVAQEPAIPGGKGGSYAIAMFPVSNGKGVSGKCYIRYASKTVPGSLSEYNDSFTTMVEPGYGPHAHFAGLKPGFYVVGARCSYNSQSLKGDSVIEIRDGQTYSTDFDFRVK